MGALDSFVGRMYIGGKRNIHRKIVGVDNQFGKWMIYYRSCARTDKKGW